MEFMKVLSVPQRIIAGAVYIGGDQPDGQGDVASPSEVFKAMLSHTTRARGAFKKMHAGENLLATGDVKVLAEYMTAAPTVLGDSYVPPFAWIIVARLSPELFAQVQAGKLSGLSMSGRAAARIKP
jgi:hypothetical protein